MADSESPRSLPAHVFPNDGRLDSDFAKKVTIDLRGDFVEQARECYALVYGTPTPPRVRLFDDYGIELFSFDAIGGIEDLCLVVTNGEDFVSIDYRGKFFKESGQLGLIKQDEITAFIQSLNNAFALDTSCRDDDLKAWAQTSNDSSDAARSPAVTSSASLPSLLTYSQGSRDEGAGEDIAIPGHMRQLEESLVDAVLFSARHTARSEAVETCVLASMPHLDIEADCESVVSYLERVAPASIDLDVIERAERTLDMPTVPMGSIPMRTPLRTPVMSAEATEGSHDSADDSKSPLTATSDADSASGHDGKMSEDMKPDGSPGASLNKRDAVNTLTVVEQARHHRESLKRADQSYRERLNTDMDGLAKAVTPTLHSRNSKISRRFLLEHTAAYLAKTRDSNEALAQERDRLLDELRAARSALMADHRHLQYRMAAVFINQLHEPVRRANRLFPKNPSQPFLGRLVFWNHVMEMVTGFKAAEVLGKTPIEVLGFAESAVVRRCHMAALMGLPDTKDFDAWPYRAPYIFRKKNGSLLSTLVFFSLLWDPESKEPTHIIAQVTAMRPAVVATDADDMKA